MAKLLTFWKKNKKREFEGVTDFFLRASDKEMEEVMIKVAKKSNELQLHVYNRAKQAAHQ